MLMINFPMVPAAPGHLTFHPRQFLGHRIITDGIVLADSLPAGPGHLACHPSVSRDMTFTIDGIGGSLQGGLGRNACRRRWIESHRLSPLMVQPQQAVPTCLYYVTSYNIQDNATALFYHQKTTRVAKKNLIHFKSEDNKSNTTTNVVQVEANRQEQLNDHLHYKN